MNNGKCGMQRMEGASTLDRMVGTMSRKNAWFLITSDEIEDIRNGLQDLRNEVPCDCQYRVQEILAIIDSVQDRLA
jgi:hypothetical protein